MWRVLFLLIISTFLFGQDNERWDVKTLTDPACKCVNPRKVRTIRLSELPKSPRIRVGDNEPRLPKECNVIEVIGIVKDIKPEDDGDIHIELGMPNRDTGFFVCEVVDPRDPSAKHSKFLTLLRKAHNSASVLRKGDRVRIQGVLFQDQKHGRQGKRMSNYLEIHPVLYILEP
jgi:hypothetical protein